MGDGFLRSIASRRPSEPTGGALEQRNECGRTATADAMARGRRLRAMCWVATLAVVTLGGCAHSSAPSAQTTASPSERTTAIQAPPGCSQFCEDAGPSAGDSGPATYTCAVTGCLPCPQAGCLAVLSTSAVVRNGVFEAKVRCLVSRQCRGAFVVWKLDSLASDGRLAGSDISVAGNETTEIRVATTPLGEELARTAGGYKGSGNATPGRRSAD
jgi:hypothetical protein